VLGDGRIALILSTEGIARHAVVRFDSAPPGPRGVAREQKAEAQTVLLFRYGPLEQFAMPLAMIRRIVMVSANRIERVGEQEFFAVDGVSTRILRLDQCLSVSARVEREPMFLLLPKDLKRPLGILFSELIDTESLTIDLNTEAHRAEGVIGSALVRGRMTLFPDLYRLADLMDGTSRGQAVAPTPSRKYCILLVEDTQFFRQVVRGYLEEAGHEVVVAIHGAEGLQALDRQSFDLVVSDIEMPMMYGWSFARAVRQRPSGERMPLLALTTLNNESDRERALACGFDRYEVKLDRERFLAAVTALLHREHVPA